MRIDFERLAENIKRLVQNFRFPLRFNGKKKLVLVISFVFLILIILFSFVFSSARNASNPDMPLTIQAYGMLDPLDEAMDDNALLRDRVMQLMSYEPAFLFANYRQVNAEIAEILFLWSGLTPEQLRALGSRRAVNEFLRQVHALPRDIPVENNPALGERPWPRLFTRFKARLLMMGQGHRIYKGRAYYDSLNDQMVVEGTLSPAFVETFAAFIKTQPENSRRPFINNFLVFVDETKGLENLSEKEKELARLLTN